MNNNSLSLFNERVSLFSVPKTARSFILKKIMQFQDLKNFKLPPNFRGRPAWYVQTWWLVQMLFFKNSPQFMYGWRRFLLRCFGAKIGKGVLIRPTAHVQFPWKLEIDEYCWIGDG